MRTRVTFRAKTSSRKLVRRASTFSILSVAAALVVTNLTPVVATEAAWTDEEWDHAAVGTLSCTDDGIFKTRGSGKLLGGGLLPLDLDDVAGVGGVTVTHDGDETHPRPVTASEAGDAYVNPIDVDLLSVISLPLTGGSLDDLLSLPLATEVGAVNQYALADGSGISQGASGVVNDSGVVQTDNDDNGNLPTLGTLKLSTLVQQLTGQALSDIVAGVADLELEIGAVASRSTLDACGAAWSDDLDANLTREYAIAGLGVGLDAPIVGGLTGTLNGLLDGLETALNGLASDAGVLSDITSGVGGLLDGVLGSLQLGSTTITGPAITIDLSTVRDLATVTIADDAGAVSLDLSTGHVTIDLGSLLGEAYGGQGFNGMQAHGLNGLPPNTELVLNDQVVNALVAALTQALDNWVRDVLDALESAVYAAGVKVQISLVLGGAVSGSDREVAAVNITADASLGSLLNGTAVIGVGLSLLGGECTGITTPISCLIAALVNPLITGITSALTVGVGPLLGGILEAAILGEDGLVPTLGSTLAAATAPVVSALATVLVGFLGVDGLVSLRANIQNTPAAGADPDPVPALTYPDWEDGSIPDGQYDVAALSVGVLNVLGPGLNVNLELARASVGVSCAVDGVWDGAGRCDGY